MEFILLGFILGIIGRMYLGLARFLIDNDKEPIKRINKSIVGYFAIMVSAIISIIIGLLKIN